MWITSLDSTHRSTALVDAAIEILVDSESLLIPLDGELLLVSGYGCVERLVPGKLATVAAHERISVENHTAQPASMLVWLAPATFVETLTAVPVRAMNGASC